MAGAAQRLKVAHVQAQRVVDRAERDDVIYVERGSRTTVPETLDAQISVSAQRLFTHLAPAMVVPTTGRSPFAPVSLALMSDAVGWAPAISGKRRAAGMAAGTTRSRRHYAVGAGVSAAPTAFSSATAASLILAACAVAFAVA